MLNIHHEPGTDILMTTAVKKLDKADYDQFIKTVKDLIEHHGNLRWYFEIQDFYGWTVKELWTDIQFDFSQVNVFDKIAIVGRRDWMNWMVQLMKPFTAAEVQFFELEEQEQARAWLKS